MKKENKKIIIISLLTSLTIIGIIIFSLLSSREGSLSASSQQADDTAVQVDNTNTYEGFREFLGDDIWGYGLGFNNPLHERGEGVVWNSTTEDLNLTFVNATADAEFLLKVFWNYEEVEFSVDGSELKTSYVFQSEYSEDYDWSISFSDEIDLSSEGFIGYLTPVIFINSDAHQKEAKIFDHKDYGIVAIHYIFSDNNFEQYNRYNVYNSLDFQRYNDYPDEYYGFNVTDNSDILYNPSPFVTAKKGEQVTLDFILGDGSGEQIEEYLIFALLGNEQAVINGEKVLPISLPIDPETNEPIAQTGELVIDVPDEAGQYEFVAYAVSLEPEIRGLSLVDNSFRITVVVE